jgi:hypothetical protein
MQPNMSQEEKKEYPKIKHTPIDRSIISENAVSMAVMCTTVYIIDCLPDSERSFDKNIRQQIKDIHAEKKYNLWGMTYFRVHNSNEFFEALSIILGKTHHRHIPLIHFEAHGNAVKGLQVGNSREFIGWRTLCEKLRKINIACYGFLGVISASCYGFELVKHVDIKRSAPFSFLLASPDEPTVGYLEENFSALYKDLFETRNLGFAFRHFAKGTSKNPATPLFLVFTIEHFLSEKFLSYLREDCTAKERINRVNDAITRYKSEFGDFSPDKLSKVRKAAKAVTAPDNRIQLIEQLSEKFLTGRPWLISLEEISTKFFREN